MDFIYSKLADGMKFFICVALSIRRKKYMYMDIVILVPEDMYIYV